MSSWTPVLIIIFVVAMAFGPLMWFRSSPAQRRLVEARRYAAELGLSVRVLTAGDLELPGVDSSELLAGYCLLPAPSDKANGKAPMETQPWRLIKERISHEAHFDGYWNWHKKRAAKPEWHPLLREVLRELPADALALDYQRAALCVFWRERGRKEEIEGLAGLLRQALERMAREADRG